MQLIDTHCHLTNDRYDNDRDTVITATLEQDIAHCITIGTGIADGHAARTLAQKYNHISCAVGMDPFSSNDASDNFSEHLQQLDELLNSNAFCALGEIGLDYYYTDLGSPQVQAKRFEQQLEMAVAHDLPVVIHVRDAHDDMISILNNHPKNRGVIHSFTGDVPTAERYLQLEQWMLSYNGIATFKNGTDVLAAATITPTERLLIETDAPYLAPIPKRGRRNEPAYVAHTCKRIAEARNDTMENIAAITTANAIQLFNIAL